MLYLALGLAVLALLIALAALGRAASASARIEEIGRDLRRRFDNLAEESSNEGDLRRVVAALAEGTPMTAEMVLEGRMWREIGAAEGLELVTTGGARVLDVRTPGETAGGTLPDALTIPLDQLEDRHTELPRDGRPLLVYCAAGMRSAAACDFLSNQGVSGLHNLAGGIGAWAGPTVRP